MRDQILNAFNSPAPIDPVFPKLSKRMSSREDWLIYKLQKVADFLVLQTFNGESWGRGCIVSYTENGWGRCGKDIYMDTRQGKDEQLIGVFLHEFRHLHNSHLPYNGKSCYEKEYDSDAFSKKLGFGVDVAEFLQKQEPFYIQTDHPPIKDRIARLLK